MRKLTLIKIYAPGQKQTGGTISASDITGWLGKIGGVISDIFVPGSSLALEAAMDNLGSAIDDYIAEKKAAAATKAWLKIKRDVSANTTFTDWQKSQILNLMNSIQLANTAGNTTKVKELQARISKLRTGDYHDSAQYKQFRQLIDATNLDTQSKGIIFGWLDDAKNPANDLTDAQRQAKWDNITTELTKAQIAQQTGKRAVLGNAPTAKQIAAHNLALEKQAGVGTGQRKGANTSKATATRMYKTLTNQIAQTGNIKEKNRLEEEAARAAQIAGIEHVKTIHKREPTGKKIGTIGEVLKNKADRARALLDKDEISKSIIDDYRANTTATIEKLKNDIEGIGIANTKLKTQSVVFDKVKNKMPMTLHTVVFDDAKGWKKPSIKKWLADHNYKHDYGFDVQPNTIRVRQIPPEKFIQKSFRTKKLGDSGIMLVLGKLI